VHANVLARLFSGEKYLHAVHAPRQGEREQGNQHRTTCLGQWVHPRERDAAAGVREISVHPLERQVDQHHGEHNDAEDEEPLHLALALARGRAMPVGDGYGADRDPGAAAQAPAKREKREEERGRERVCKRERVRETERER